MGDIVEIPVGEYVIGDDGIPNAGPRHRRNLREPTWIDARPVTWSHFEAFVEGGGYSQELLAQDAGSANGGGACSVDQRTRYLVEQFVDLVRRGYASRSVALSEPITGLTWFEASAVARFYGARLPYEVEWEIANSGRANGKDSRETTRSVGAVSRLGCTLFIGQLQEWTLDAFSNRYWRADVAKRGIEWRLESGDSGVTVRGAGPDDMFQHVSYRGMAMPMETSVFRAFRRVWDKRPLMDNIKPTWGRR